MATKRKSLSASKTTTGEVAHVDLSKKSLPLTRERTWTLLSHRQRFPIVPKAATSNVRPKSKDLQSSPRCVSAEQGGHMTTVRRSSSPAPAPARLSLRQVESSISHKLHASRSTFKGQQNQHQHHQYHIQQQNLLQHRTRQKKTPRPTAKESRQSPVASSTGRRPFVPLSTFQEQYNELRKQNTTLTKAQRINTQRMKNYQTLPQQRDELSADLITVNKNLASAIIQHMQIVESLELEAQHFDDLKCYLCESQQEVDLLNDEVTILESEHSARTQEVEALHLDTMKLKQKSTQLGDELSVCQQQLYQSISQRKELRKVLDDLTTDGGGDSNRNGSVNNSNSSRYSGHCDGNTSHHWADNNDAVTTPHSARMQS